MFAVSSRETPAELWKVISVGRTRSARLYAPERVPFNRVDQDLAAEIQLRFRLIVFLLLIRGISSSSHQSSSPRIPEGRREPSISR
jgi:hypothetical protein